MLNIKELGEQLLTKECPENDCVIYRNTYKMLCEIMKDLSKCAISDTSCMYLTMAKNELYNKLSKMYYNNNAILIYRRNLRG